MTVAEIGGKRALYTALREMQADMHTLFSDVAARIGGVMRSYATADGTIPQARGVELRVEIGSIIDGMFTGTLPGRRGRHAFGPDGVTPLAEYPRLLNHYLVQVIRAVVGAHAAYLRRVMPDDV